MPNLRITVDEQLLRKARARARKEGMSLDALLTSFLAQYVRDIETQDRAIQDVLALSRASRSSSGRKCWTRDELHERDA
jgi:hypothetical protein